MVAVALGDENRTFDVFGGAIREVMALKSAAQQGSVLMSAETHRILNARRKCGAERMTMRSQEQGEVEVFAARSTCDVL
jgi:class 3 adenylate cyclase